MSSSYTSRKWHLTAFHIMVKPRGPICNLDFSYCYFLSKELMYPGNFFIMSDEVLEVFTRQYIRSQQTPKVTFAWQGGEPTLMGLDFFQKAIECQKKYTPEGMKVENALQTNATLLDDEWCAFLKENNFLIGISLDGPLELHNIYRVDKGGNDTSDRVLKGLELAKKAEVDFNILCSVNAGNADYPLEVYQYFRDELKVAFIQFIPIVERDNKTGFQIGNKTTPRSVTAKQYGDFLIDIYDEWVQNDVGSVFVQIFDVSLGKWMGVPGGLCVFEETCGLGLALEHSGDLFSCDHFVEPKHKLGSILKSEIIDLVNSHKQYKFGMDKRDTLPKYCQEYDLRFACNRGCPKNRFKHTPDGEFELDYLCEDYKAFFRHINEPMINTFRIVSNSLFGCSQLDWTFRKTIEKNPSRGLLI